MTREIRKPKYLEIGYKKYFYLDEICSYLEMDMDDAYEFLCINGIQNWHITSLGEITTDSIGFKLLMTYKDKDKHIQLIEEMLLIHEEEQLQKEASELFGKQREIEKKLKVLEEHYDELDIRWRALNINNY